MKLKGFTLPEVFCTMIVLAILSLLFWQTIYPVYTKMVASRKIKNFHSIMKQVKLKSRATNVTWDDYYYEPDNLSASDFALKYILPYVSTIEKNTDNSEEAKIILQDALSFKVRKNNKSCMDFILDINDDAMPNVIGRDIFYFTFCPYSDTEFIRQGDVIPYKTKDMISRNDALEKCRTTPEYCTGLIAFDKFSFENDYPHKIPL